MVLTNTENDDCDKDHV